jgi:hypothetical protein
MGLHGLLRDVPVREVYGHVTIDVLLETATRTMISVTLTTVHCHRLRFVSYLLENRYLYMYEGLRGNCPVFD